jgi:putative flippase GtrA
MIKIAEKIFISKTNNISIQFFRSVIVGGIAATIDLFFLYICTNYLNIYYLISAGISFTIGLLVNYFLSKKWIFSEEHFQNKLTEFGIFLIIGIIGLLLNELFIWYFTDQIHLYYMLSKILTIFLVFLWNFSSRKFILFR